MEHAESLLRAAGIIGAEDSLYDAHNIMVVHHLNAALRAHNLYQRDVDYIVRDGEVIIVDEFTGRTLAGRRWSDGLHQAVEAKEGVPIQRESHTFASITFQNYFRLYKKLAGMTGTADTEAYEFQQIYGLEVAVIPTHRPMIRKDHPDLVFLKVEAKWNAIIEDIKACHARKQPVLVGTTSIEVSEMLGERLEALRIPHQVLNAKQHEREAHIVAQAGRPGAVTIATNMAGRGTDIVLGGNLEAELALLPPEAGEAERAAVKAAWQKRHDEVLAAGGLHIVGSERHESRRIDNQLRGRSGRQGDAGSSRFYLSLQDNLMRIFAPDWVTKWMQIFGMKDDDALEDRMVSRQIEKAQRKVEAHNFDVRKNLLEYDDVANDQRKVIYAQRNELLEPADVKETIDTLRVDVVESIVRRFVAVNSIPDQWDIDGLERTLAADLGIQIDVKRHLDAHEDLEETTLLEKVQGDVDRFFREKEATMGSEFMRAVEKHFLLRVLDTQWRDHLANMDYLRQGIHLRGYAQKQPKQEYKREAFELFTQMLDRVKQETVAIIARVRVQSEDEAARMEQQQQVQARQQQQSLDFQHPDTGNYGVDEEAEQAQAMAADAANLPKVGRNDPCPCGSGKKFKQCHGQLA